ncbi:hypothetical protein CWR48_04055 [Oceanobacillus arenosus]|uniref:Uncharacterized protein n=1 Tax=Oceanobacillus arenosus TaxID=1229153 RepID=A0A3D8PZX5_9BACI|nr:hypothetical protein CWR48_04055 [Oceanobacillus arenosus]
MAEIEDQLGVPLSEMGKMNMSMKNVIVLVWAGLIQEDKEITQEDVGEMIDLENFEEVQGKIKAFGTVQGKNE